MPNNFYYKSGMKVLVQGATGREGSRAVGFMLDYHTNVAAGVTPGKGGQEVNKAPVFNSISEAVSAAGALDATSIYVPPAAIRAAVEEALENNIRFIHILTEGIPYADMAQIVALCRAKEAVLLGPGSLGILITGEGRVGMLGGPDPDALYRKGPVSIICRSGGMTNELANNFYRAGIGIRAAVHTGSEIISGASLVDLLKWLEADELTGIIVIFEEATHNDLTGLLEYVRRHKVKKPVLLNVAGWPTMQMMPRGASFGHIDLLLQRGRSSFEANLQSLQSRGIGVVDSYEDFGGRIKELI